MHKKNQEMMLRRLVRNDDIGPLRTLVSVIEPVKEYRRYQMRPQTMLSPLTGVIDATPPDSEAARKFSLMVTEFLNDGPRYQLYRAELSQMLGRLANRRRVAWSSDRSFAGAQRDQTARA